MLTTAHFITDVDLRSGVLSDQDGGQVRNFPPGVTDTVYFFLQFFLDSVGQTFPVDNLHYASFVVEQSRKYSRRKDIYAGITVDNADLMYI